MSGMMWALIGLGCALCGVLLALQSAFSRTPSFYEHEVYAMTRISHLRFAYMSLGFACAFTAALFLPMLPTIAVLAVYTVLFILYGASFVRGATGENE